MLKIRGSPDITPQPNSLFHCCFPVVSKNPAQILEPLPIPPIHSASPFTKSLHDLTQRARRAFSSHGFHNSDDLPLVRSESSHLLTNDTSSYFTPDFNVRSILDHGLTIRNAAGDFSDSSSAQTPLPQRLPIKSKAAIDRLTRPIKPNRQIKDMPRPVGRNQLINDVPYEESSDTSERYFLPRYPVRPSQNLPAAAVNNESPFVKFHRQEESVSFPRHMARDRETGMEEELPKEMAWTAHTPPKEYLRTGGNAALWKQMSKLSHERLTASLARVQDYYDSQKVVEKSEKPVRMVNHSTSMPQSGGIKTIKNKKSSKCAAF